MFTLQLLNLINYGNQKEYTSINAIPIPGSLVGVDYLKALRGPLPDIPLMPTGGVTLENLPDWLAAGAIAVGMGGNLAKGTPAQIESAARAVSQRLAEARSGEKR